MTVTTKSRYNKTFWPAPLGGWKVEGGGEKGVGGWRGEGGWMGGEGGWVG